ncbi:hypothetical protein BDV18DRAFT_13996 [Aspergillus unguis]
MAPKIAIVGGGPAGLTLGLLLHKQSIPFTIFELRQQPTAEELALPSGMLDLHEESGIAALKECGLHEHFQALVGECSEAQRVSDKDGNIVYADEGELSQRPEISRHALIQLLTSNLPKERIRYGHKLFSVSVRAEGVELDFGPNGMQTFNLVIGADGAWSRVRNILTETKPHYTGMQLTTATITNISTKHPHLSSLVGAGSFSALGLRHGVMSQRGPNDSARIYTFFSIPDQDFASSSRLDGADFQTAKQLLLSDEGLLGLFGPKIKDLASASWDEEFSAANKIVMKPLFTLPTNVSYPHFNSHSAAAVTLLGDAAHLMPPWAGEGVNLAMWDSLSLSRAIGTAFQESQGQVQEHFIRNLDPLLQAFEEEMFDRAREKAEETEGNGKMLFGEDGAQAFKKFFESVYGAYEP